MSSHDWSYTILDNPQAMPAHGAAATAAGGSNHGHTATFLGQWAAKDSSSRTPNHRQRARYAGQAAALLLGVVGTCAVIAHIAFG